MKDEWQKAIDEVKRVREAAEAIEREQGDMTRVVVIELLDGTVERHLILLNAWGASLSVKDDLFSVFDTKDVTYMYPLISIRRVTVLKNRED